MRLHKGGGGGVRTGKVSEKVALGEGWFFIKAFTLLLVDSLEETNQLAASTSKSCNKTTMVHSQRLKVSGSQNVVVRKVNDITVYCKITRF